MITAKIKDSKYIKDLGSKALLQTTHQEYNDYLSRKRALHALKGIKEKDIQINNLTEQVNTLQQQMVGLLEEVKKITGKK